MSIVIDNIKVKYSQEGYLPDYPPHLISDEEMCEAFIPNRVTKNYYDNSSEPFSYFYDTYPLVNKNLEDKYQTLVNAIKYHFVRFLTKVKAFYEPLPDWVYSYMLGQVVNQQSVQDDRHYLLSGIGYDNIDDVLNSDAEAQIYNISRRWVNKLDKSIKFANINTILSQTDSSNLPKFSEDDKIKIKEEFEAWQVEFEESGQIVTRPPSMFGEQSIIKLIRLGDSRIQNSKIINMDAQIKDLLDKYNIEYEEDYEIQLSEDIQYTFAFRFKSLDTLVDIDYWFTGNTDRYRLRQSCIPNGYKLIVIHEETFDEDLSNLSSYLLKAVR